MSIHFSFYAISDLMIMSDFVELVLIPCDTLDPVAIDSTGTLIVSLVVVMHNTLDGVTPYME